MHSSGKIEGLPYSFSRWTDVPAGKWPWFRAMLQQGWMWAPDPRTAGPRPWSLSPENTLALVFWTRHPGALLQDKALLRPYRLHIHLTVTGWAEVEHGVPGLQEGAELLRAAIGEYGADQVTWRFSPVPLVPDAAIRFERIASQLSPGVSVFASYLQANDRVPETRSLEDQATLAQQLAEIADSYGHRFRFCAEDSVLQAVPHLKGVCESGDWHGATLREPCGCALAVDPFTINEACCYGCEFCYAADLSLNPRKRNTTKQHPMKRLPLVP